MQLDYQMAIAARAFRESIESLTIPPRERQDIKRRFSQKLAAYSGEMATRWARPDTVRRIATAEFRGFVEDVRYYYAAKPYGEDYGARGIANRSMWGALPTLKIGAADAVLRLCAIAEGRDPAFLIVGDTILKARLGACEAPPLVRPLEDGAVELFHWAVLDRLRSQALLTTGPPPRVEPETDPYDLWNEDPDSFHARAPAEQLGLTDLAIDATLGVLGNLAHMQWILAETLARLKVFPGDGCTGAWHVVAEELMNDQGQRSSVADSLTHELEEPHESLPYLQLAARCLSAAMLDEPVEVPAYSIRLREHPEEPALMLAISHPLVAVSEISAALSDALRRARGAGQGMLPLTSEESEFVNWVESERKELGLGTRDKAPHGFWGRAAKQFEQLASRAKRPERYLAIKYVRLKKKARKNPLPADLEG